MQRCPSLTGMSSLRLQGTQFGKANREELRVLFNYLQFCLEQVVKDNELGALKQALDGAYVEPGGVIGLLLAFCNPCWPVLDPEGHVITGCPAAGAGSVWHRVQLCSSL